MEMLLSDQKYDAKHLIAKPIKLATREFETQNLQEGESNWSFTTKAKTTNYLLPKIHKSQNIPGTPLF